MSIIHILIVEDDDLMQGMLKDAFSVAKYKITIASDGMKGWKEFQTGEYDLVLLDMKLPKMDGITLCRHLRQDDRTAAIPFILLSAKTTPESVQEGLLAGANKYLTKPVARKDLIQGIEEVLAKVKVTK